MCYVRPTLGMVIKTSQTVDSSGRLYLPYLHQWKHPASDLSGLIALMIISFGESCPVFAKSSTSSNNIATSGAYAETAPFSGYGFPSVQQPTPSHSSSSSAIGFQPYGSGSTSQLPYYQSQAPYPTGPFSGFPQPHIPSSNPTQPARTSPPYPNYSTSSNNTIQPEHIRTSLLSAVQDKIRSKLRENIGTAHAELQCIKKTREDLNAGEQRIKAMLAKMQQEEDDLQNSIIVYQQATEDISKLLSLASESEELGIDDALDTTAPIYRQLLNAYVEDNAIEDCIYYLSQALKNNKLDLEVFLKNVRMLSRQQFYLRAIMIKCRGIAGLNTR
uniref:Tumor susceptibility gene 101 protein n=1 Tax=Romanomermis culicivorax TaxID=13658 RepID=A0A915IS90_ROMCU